MLPSKVPLDFYVTLATENNENMTFLGFACKFLIITSNGHFYWLEVLDNTFWKSLQEY
jgi:hypothetical protein